MNRILSIIIIVCTTIPISSCSDNDVSPDLTKGPLAFSKDTVDFSMVFPEKGSVTKQLRIYNKKNSDLNIQSIELVNPSTSGFLLNLDGEKGTRFSNVNLLKKDSLFAFIQLNIKEQIADIPTRISDSIRFVTSSGIQYVYLEAIGQNVVVWEGKTIASDTIITGQKPILIYDSLVISHGSKVTLESNTRLLFANKASLEIYGTLDAKGTLHRPVVMRGIRSDVMDESVPYDFVPGQWGGVTFHSASYDNSFENVRIRNSENGVYFKQSSPINLKIKMLNTIVENNSKAGVIAANCRIEGSNCLFANSGGPALQVMGGDYIFNQCTIVNYYGWGKRVASALGIYNYQIATVFPLQRCDIINSVIYGGYTNELEIGTVGDNASSYRFINCLIKAKELTDSHFTNCIWNNDPQFIDLAQQNGYSYNFRLQPTSPAIGAADKPFAGLVPNDLDGVARDSNPDIGCFEWKEE